MAKRRKRSRESSTARKTKVQTSPAIIMIALVVAGLGAVWFGLAAVVFATKAKFGLSALAGAVVVRGLIGGAIGAALVGSFMLVLGANLGPRFSYPFMLCMLSGLGQLVALGLDSWGIAAYEASFWPMTITVLVLSGIASEVLAGDISGYTSHARSLAASFALAFLVGGTLFLWFQSGQKSFSWWFVIRSLSFASYGGAFGAVTSAVKVARY